MTAAESEAVLDPITFSVLLNRLGSIATEMTVALANTATSALLALTHDFSCCVYDGKGRQLAMKDALPIHTNSMHLFIARIVEVFGEDLHEGDIIACNDPYSGNTHIGDLATAAPVFHDGEILFWTAVRAHQLDVGAPAATSSWAGARNIWQEGLTIPPVKLYEAGRVREDVVELYLANMRWRETLKGDLMAQLGATRIGVEKLRGTARRYGAETIRSFCDEAIEYAARRTRAEIESIPDGTYSSTAWFDFGAAPGTSATIRCTLTVAGDAITIDFAGSDAELDGSVNASYAVLQAAGGIPVMMAIDPDIPHNEGCLRCVTVRAPEGTVCNASFPTATSLATVLPGDVMQEAVTRGLAQAIPDRVAAGSAHWSNVPMISGTDPVTGEYWGHQPLNGGGGGGAARGVDGWPLITTNAAWGSLDCASVEHTELLHPLIIECWEIESESMGLGEWIGGPGIRFELRTTHEVELIYVSDGLVNPPCGLLGGHPGAGGGSYVQRDDGLRRFLPHEAYVRLDPGERWVGVSSGGGGYGDPVRRPSERVRDDVRDGLYSRATAARLFGVILRTDDSIDTGATQTARAELAADRGEVPSSLPGGAAASRWLVRMMRDGDVLVPIPESRGL